MFASACAQPITQRCQLKVKVSIEDNEFEPLISCPHHTPLPLEGFSLNFGQMFALVGQCAEPITQPCRLKVKVNFEDHDFEP